MPFMETDDTRIYYEEYGEGFPILLFAAGGMRSAIPFWQGGWKPIETLSPHFRVIAMDQRNAGQSTAPITGSDGWSTYTADHVALLDHLNVERCHVLGGCIGGPYCFGVIQAAPNRVASAVLQQTIGASENREAFYEMFDSWANNLKDDRPEVSAEDWNSFRSNMFDGDFLYNVDRDFVRNCQIPMLVLMGNDLYHPQVTSREIASIAPNAELVEEWSGEELSEQTANKVVEFLKAHSP